MPYRIDEIMAIAEKYGIPVVEDAAEGMGSRFNCQVLGTFGKYGVLSFNGNKMMTTSGGALICRNEKDANEIMWYATIRQHGDAVTTVKTTIGDEGVNEGVNEGVSALGKGAKETYSIICSNPGINTPRLVSMSGKSDATIERHIALLKKEKMIEHRGSDKTGGYYPVEKNS